MKMAMFSDLTKKFMPMSQGDKIEAQGLLEDVAINHKKRARPSYFAMTFMLLNVALFITSISILWKSGACVRDMSYNDLLKKTSAYSPVFDHFDFGRPVTRKFNGLIRDKTPIWRQPPSPAVDAAWNYLSMEGMETLSISASEVAKSHKNVTRAVQVPTSFSHRPSGSEPQYLAQIDVFHNIHCLDMLRKEVWSEHYFPNQSFLASDNRKTHKAHCIHMLLQTLTCSADVGVIVHNWVRNDLWTKGPKTQFTADFGVQKQCRNFESLRKWAGGVAIKDEERLGRLLQWEEGMPWIYGNGYGPDTGKWHSEGDGKAVYDVKQDL